MRPGPSPLVGYNTNVRHKGKLYHIQTEDSGINHPHVITHLFADGGRIIASRKTGYAEHLASKELQAMVKRLMQEQHKSMFIELRDCVYDEDLGAGESSAGIPAAAHADSSTQLRPPSHERAAQPAVSKAPPKAPLDIEAFERAADARMAESISGRARQDVPRRGAGRYQQTVPATQASRPPTSRKPPSPSIFGGEVSRGKSLDEVILSYLSDDVGEGDR